MGRKFGRSRGGGGSAGGGGPIRARVASPGGFSPEDDRPGLARMLKGVVKVFTTFAE